MSWLAGMILLVQITVCPQQTLGANVMNYGADGNDYFQFTTPSMAFDKASGFTTLITFAMHVDANGTLEIAGVACTNGVYVGPSNWNSLITTLKTAPTTVTRYEVCIGGWQDTSYNNIKSLIASQGIGPGSILYKNFQALKNAVPGIDAINDDDELTYDLSSATSFANMLGGLGYKFTMVPYQNQSFWVNLYSSVTNCDYIYLQCYEGGAGNDPGQWNSAIGHGVKVVPGQESNTSNPATFRSWYLETGVQGGFYYPDVVFNSTYWSAAVIEANGNIPTTPTGLTATGGGQQVALSWNVVPGAISYNLKRSTVSGGETNEVNISTANNNWPASNEYLDTGLAANTTYYYEVSAVNTNGESASSTEMSAVAQAATVLNFETPNVGSGNFEYDPTGGPWTFTGASPNGSGIVSDDSEFGNPNAPGSYLQGGFVQEDGSISQSISGFTPGTTYTITFSAAERSGNSQSWNIKVNNSVIGSYNPGSSATAYTDYTATFTATASTSTLQFVGTDLAGGDNTVFIDNMRISPPLLPVPTVTTNTLPATDVDVIGSQVTFAAAFGGATPMSYQWEIIKSGATNNIIGATNSTLTLSNLALINTASYQLKAANAYGTAVSSPAALSVNVPTVANNVTMAFAAQTGLGPSDVLGTSFTPTWTVATNNSLIADEPPLSSNGDFTMEEPGRSVISLTAGGNGTIGVISGTDGYTTSTNYVTCGNNGTAGSNIVYTLPGSVTGYSLTNITVYGGWADAGRDWQEYIVYYSTVSAPTVFNPLATVNFEPKNSAGVECATRVTLTPVAGSLATNVSAVEFNFSSPPSDNGYCGYSQMAIFGNRTVPNTPTNISSQITANGLTLSWPQNYTGWQLQMQTNSLSAGLGTNWINVPGSMSTNQMTFPMNPNGSVFYRLAH